MTADGTVFVAVKRPDVERNAYLGGIQRMRLDQPALQPFTQGERDSSPLVTPDGATLLFLRAATEKDKPQLYVLPVAGGEARRLTDHPLGVESPVLSPSGDRVAYLARVPEPGRYGTDPDVNPDAEPPRRITALNYRLDDVGFLRDRPRQAFVVDVSGGDPRRLTNEPGDVSDPAFSADGEEILYVRDQPGTRISSEIVAVPVDVESTAPAHARLVVAPGGLAEAPVAAGDRVYFVGTPFPGVDMSGRTSGLWWVVKDGRQEPVRMTDELTVDVETATGPVLVTDDAVLVTVRDRGSVGLRSVPLSAENVPLDDLPLLTDTHVEVKAQVRAGVRVVAVIADPTSAGEIHLLDAAGGDQTLTELSAPLQGAGLIAPKEIETAGPDGYPVHGWLFLPPGEGPHPVILLIHGGPHAAYGWGVFDEAQVYAAAGYAVVMGNPRGSAGYGLDHGRVLVGRLGEVDVTDVLTLLDAALEHPECDATRVGVMGGSYGGFMTSWLVGHHGDRFRAGISERALNAWDSFEGSSDIGYGFGESYVGTGRDRQWSMSPLAAAGDIAIPLLIIHSEQDWRCPIEQAQRLFVALANRGAPVEMLLFPGEGHELSRSGQPRHRVQRFEAILDWWGRHLTP